MKRSATMDRLEAKYKAKYEAKKRAEMDMLMQMGQDAAMIATNDVLHLGPGRAEAFCLAYIDAMNDMARLTVDAQKDDKEFVYAKEKIDQRIRAIVGEKNFAPWEERYGK